MENQFFKSVRSSVKQWYLPVIMGIILIITAVLTFAKPEASYLALSIVFSISFLMTGILETVFAISNKDQLDNWGWLLALGILTTLMGIGLMAYPAIPVAALPLYVGFVLLFRSFGAIATAMDLKNYDVKDWKTLMIFGVLGVIFSFILLFNPLFSMLTIIIWTGVALLTSGIFSIILGFRMRGLHKNWDKISDDVKSKFEEAKNKLAVELNKFA